MSTLDKNDASNPLDEDASGGQAISVPDSGDTGESGKLKMIISLIKKCLGVKDIASMYVAGLVYSVRLPRRPLLSHQAFVTSCIPTGTDPEPGVLALLGQTRPLRCVSNAKLDALPRPPTCPTCRINDSDDPFERMLAVLRFTFSKDLKFIVRTTSALSPCGRSCS